MEGLVSVLVSVSDGQVSVLVLVSDFEAETPSLVLGKKTKNIVHFTPCYLCGAICYDKLSTLPLVIYVVPYVMTRIAFYYKGQIKSDRHIHSLHGSTMLWESLNVILS